MSGISTAVAALVSFGVTLLLGKILIPILRRMHFGQSIREDGPKWHMSKQGTPIMGGLMFIAGITLGIIAGYLVLLSTPNSVVPDTAAVVRMFAGLAMALLFGAIGFIDDYIKAVKKRNLGLGVRQKIILQVLVTALYLAVLYWCGERNTLVQVPFLGTWNLGWFYYPILGILIIGIVNSVNLNDGIDGLCGSITFLVGTFFMLAAAMFGWVTVSLPATALAAGCVAFLLYNAHPARVFMGDTGSLFLGGMVVALGFGVRMEFLLLIVGFVYCFESLSVIMQVISFKLTGKRIFKMSPIHHHFEMCGWSENKIVLVFSLVTVLMCVVGFFAVYQVR